MRFNHDTRTRLLVTVRTDFDPASATAELKVDGTWFPLDWLAAATPSGTTWTRPARTVAYFAGPNVTSAGGATVLTAGRHATETRVTNGGDVIASPATPVDVD